MHSTQIITTPPNADRAAIVRSRLIAELGDCSNGIPANAGEVFGRIMDELPPPHGYISVAKFQEMLGEFYDQDMTIRQLRKKLRRFGRQQWIYKAASRINDLVIASRDC